jgi:hypothetical protein
MDPFEADISNPEIIYRSILDASSVSKEGGCMSTNRHDLQRCIADMTRTSRTDVRVAANALEPQRFSLGVLDISRSEFMSKTESISNMSAPNASTRLPSHLVPYFSAQ